MQNSGMSKAMPMNGVDLEEVYSYLGSNMRHSIQQKTVARLYPQLAKRANLREEGWGKGGAGKLISSLECLHDHIDNQTLHEKSAVKDIVVAPRRG